LAAAAIFLGDGDHRHDLISFAPVHGLFLLLALIKVFGKRRAWLVGAAFGFAMLSRAISAKKLKTSFRLSS
jgi:hypothetical protein